MTNFRINHINDVLPFVQDRKDFVIADKGDYTVIDYVFAGQDTFDHPARLECRGIKFAPDGSVLSRPLHKFKNIGETPDLQPDKLDFTQPHVIMDKLDGSMIHSAIVNGEVVFMTRMGRTDVARQAERRHLTPELAKKLGYYGVMFTHIFEWTAPDNRIVVRYDESKLTLLAIRHKTWGDYLSQSFVDGVAAELGVPSVRCHNPQHTNAADFLAYARAIQGEEGFVVRFESGLWVKAKGDDYVLKHRAKDGITHEKNILALVLNGGLDDVLPLLDEADAKAAREYAEAVEFGIARQADAIAATVSANDNLPQKDFALNVVSALPEQLRPAAFQIRSGQRPHDVIRARLAANTNTQSQVDANRVLHGATWRIA